MPIRPEVYENIVRFHEENIYLPTRTIYFGGSPRELDGQCDEVTAHSAGQLIKNLHILECEKIAPITILLNTIGGFWEDGIAIYDIITTLKSPVNIIGLGKLYSMGSVILQAAKERILLPNTTLMVHDGSDGFSGDAKSYEKWAVHSKQVRETMYQIYYERINKINPLFSLKQIEELCEHDSIFNAQESVELGLADQIIETLNHRG